MTAADVTWLDPDTVQLRQPKASHWEAPFLFLLFGRDRAILFDTGATSDERVFALRGAVDGAIETWLRKHPARFARPYELVVAHTHAHGDHIAGDALLAARPGTTVVGTTPAEVIAFFGFPSWPDAVVPFDLGGRVIDVIGAPGHEPSAVVYYDRATRILFTGDTVCPGNLYVRDRAQFVQTIDRLIRFRDATKPRIETVLGAHVEMSTTPGVDYPPGTVDQPDEAPLALPPSILDEVRAALDVSGKHGTPKKRVVRDRFILVDDQR
ncbi:MBL fold metallo-hydrolase [Leifsonia sp. Le1]|uniref:MBL fold metallo-hydrolase n=1 Tax=Leifsonia sp. Le1 TaxID=3404918 RepID=UPI003EB86D12